VSAGSRVYSPRARTAWFWVAVAGCVGAYLAMQVIYIERVPLIMDEFDGAYDVFRLRNEIPYRDFSPYKTVLGYYVQLVPLLLGTSVWQGLINVKIAMALLNSVCIVAAVALLRRVVSRRAILLALPLWLSMSEWLERSSELRVDTMTGLAGLFSLIALLRTRPLLSGLLAGISFLVSQKGAYFEISAGAALCLSAVLESDRRAALVEIRRFALGSAIVLVPYFLIFTLLGSVERTTRVTFLSHTAIAFTTLYPRMYRFWLLSIARNPGFYGLIVAGLILFSRRVIVRRFGRGLGPGDAGDRARVDQLLCGYAITLYALGVWHRQPWPYFFVLIVPTGFVVVAVMFERVIEWGVKKATVRNLENAASKSLFERISMSKILFSLVLLSLVPQAIRATIRLQEDSGYQRDMITLISKIVRQGQYYLAGVDLLYDREQSSRALRRLSRVERKRLRTADDATVKSVLDELRTRPPIVLVNNFRFNSFPKTIKRFLKAQYEPYWGSIDIYSPTFERGEQVLSLAFTGRYRVVLRNGSSARIGDKIVRAGKQIDLTAGEQQITSKYAGRLQIQIDGVDQYRDARYEKRQLIFEDRIYER
jgi:hypothetical protein